MVEILRRKAERFFLLQWRKTPPDWDGQGEIFKLGPKEWLIRRDTPHPALVEITEGLAGFTLSGARMRDVLAKGTSLDLHPRGYPPGTWARTLFAQVPAVIHYETASSSFALYVDISYARHIAQWLEDSAREFA